MSVKVRGGRVLGNSMNLGVSDVFTTFFRLLGRVSLALATSSLALSQRCIPPGTSHISLQSPSAANASFLSLRIRLPSDVLGSLFSVPIPLVISSASFGVFLLRVPAAAAPTDALFIADGDMAEAGAALIIDRALLSICWNRSC